ncbi:hypothetical protein TDIS_1255 [Thermosulfurimonas dismutans]|uniref:Uncharacterized protein n=1 Tax=Thermosulfurimonas dismutans TaxID=999894 RepID=A0A179D3I4_9BACT|nr:hypothetical protein TDIS_1255 [Thermosulfurimonas dismutans]
MFAEFKILYLNQTNSCSADTTALEKQIDRLVCKLYNLTPKEIGLIEKNVFLKHICFKKDNIQKCKLLERGEGE